MTTFGMGERVIAGKREGTVVELREGEARVQFTDGGAQWVAVFALKPLAPPAALSADEQAALIECEIVIERGLQTFVEVGTALATIRDQKLYRLTHKTFEDYCDQRWSMQRAHAYRLMEAAQVVTDLSPIGDILPANEAQARPLTAVPADQRAAVWHQAVETAPHGKVTGAHVQSVVDEQFGKPASAPERGSDAFAVRNALKRAYEYALSQPDGWYTYAYGNLQSRELLSKLVHHGLVEAEAFEQPEERLRLTAAGCKQLGKPEPDWMKMKPAPATSWTEAYTPAAPRVPPVPTKPDQLKQALRDAGLSPFRVVAHKGEWADTYSAGFHTDAYGEAAEAEAQAHADAIRALGYVVISAGVDIAPGFITLGFGGERTPIVHFAEAGYEVPTAVPPTPNVLHSSDSNEWYTPALYVDAARAVLGAIDLDPASCDLANGVVRARQIFTLHDDGYARDWFGRVWLNPPYGRDGGESNQARWSAKLLAEYQQGRVAAAVLLVNATTDRQWFKPLWQYPLCFTDHRINFYNNTGKQDDPTHGNVFVYFGSDMRGFTEHFRQFGQIVIPCDGYSNSLRGGDV